MWISACICFCIYRFLHFFFSVFRSSCISICLPPYPLHMLCISAFLHFCIARLLQFWICSRMLRCVYFCIFGFPHFCISVFLSFCMLPDVRPQSFVNVRCFVLIFADVRRLSQICISALLLSFCNDPIEIRRGNLGRNHKAKEEAN